jgi:hypothetical protein
MNILRMFAFIAAVLITVILFRVIGDGLTDERAVHVTTEANATDQARAAGN